MREGIDLGLCGLSADAGAEGSGRVSGARRRAWRLLWLVIPGAGAGAEAGVACILHFWASLRTLGSRKADLPRGDTLGRWAALYSGDKQQQ